MDFILKIYKNFIKTGWFRVEGAANRHLTIQHEVA